MRKHGLAYQLTILRPGFQQWEPGFQLLPETVPFYIENGAGLGVPK